MSCLRVSKSLVLTVGEMNAWLNTMFRSSGGSDESSGLVVVPGTPNVAVSEDGVLHVNLPTEISGYTLEGEYVLSATGRFSIGAPASFVFSSFQVGGAKVPVPEVLGAQIANALLKGYEASDEFQAIVKAWERVDAVEVAEGGLNAHTAVIDFRWWAAVVAAFLVASNLVGQGGGSLHSAENRHFETVGLHGRSVSFVNELSGHVAEMASRFLRGVAGFSSARADQPAPGCACRV